jgi:hypothetical protein
MLNKKFKKIRDLLFSAFRNHHNQFSSKEEQHSKFFFFRQWVCVHSPIQYTTLSIFITVTYCTTAITTELNNILFLLLATFVNLLMFIIFKLTCILGMDEYYKSAEHIGFSINHNFKNPWGFKP